MSAYYFGKNSSVDLAKVLISDEARATKKKNLFSFHILNRFVSGVFFKNLNLLFIIRFTKFTVHA